MKPAICFLCGKPAAEEHFENKGDWIEFAEYNQENSISLEHPSGLEYLCDEHLSAAKILAEKSSREALTILRNQFGDFSSRIYQQTNAFWWHRLINLVKR